MATKSGEKRIEQHVDGWFRTRSFSPWLVVLLLPALLGMGNGFPRPACAIILIAAFCLERWFSRSTEGTDRAPVLQTRGLSPWWLLPALVWPWIDSPVWLVATLAGTWAVNALARFLSGADTCSDDGRPGRGLDASILFYLLASLLALSPLRDLAVPVVFVAWAVTGCRLARTIAGKTGGIWQKPVKWALRGLIMLLAFWIIGLHTAYMAAGRGPSGRHAVLRVGHRGAAGLAAENTLAAIRRGIAVKCDLVEVDVRQTRDRVLVIMHDETVDRTTNGQGTVKDLSLGEIRALDAGTGPAAAGKGLKIPLLEEVLDALANGPRLMLEIKQGDEVYPGIEERIVGMLRAKGAVSRCLVISFDDGILRRVRRLCPELSLCKLAVGPVPLCPLYVDHGLKLGRVTEYGGVEAISLNFSLITPELVAEAHANGLAVFAWTVDSPDMIRADD